MGHEIQHHFPMIKYLFPIIDEFLSLAIDLFHIVKYVLPKIQPLFRVFFFAGEQNVSSDFWIFSNFLEY